MQSPLDGGTREGPMSDLREVFSEFEKVSSDRPLSGCRKHVCLVQTHLPMMGKEEEEGLDLSPGL